MPVLWRVAWNTCLYQLPNPARQPAIRRRSSEKSRRGGVFAEPSVGSQFEIVMSSPPALSLRQPIHGTEHQPGPRPRGPRKPPWFGRRLDPRRTRVQRAGGDDESVAERVAKIFARAEQHMLDSQRQYSAECDRMACRRFE
jgi:hypothetical protein